MGHAAVFTCLPQPARRGGAGLFTLSAVAEGLPAEARCRGQAECRTTGELLKHLAGGTFTTGRPHSGGGTSEWKTHFLIARVLLVTVVTVLLEPPPDSFFSSVTVSLFISIFQNAAKATAAATNTTPTGTPDASSPLYLISEMFAPNPAARNKAPRAIKSRIVIHLRITGSIFPPLWTFSNHGGLLRTV